ncbi:MAG: hypothetical protein IPG58_17230 [Acidobacteria bacterium]|nr:hypothetical protein [Acidobacteriota bacterium]
MLTKFDLARADIYLLVLSVFTVAIGSRATIQIPRFKSHVSVSDTFIFLTLLLYGGEYAVVLAAIEATASSWRFCNRKLTVFFNAATMALATTAVILVLKAFSLYDDALLHGNGANRQSFVISSLGHRSDSVYYQHITRIDPRSDQGIVSRSGRRGRRSMSGHSSRILSGQLVPE